MPRFGLVVLVALVGASVWFAAPAGAVGGGTKSWRAFYDGGVVDSFGKPGDDSAHATAASPDGTKVFVTGSSDGPAGQGKNYATVAYNASTGAQLWVATYTSTASGAPVQYDDVAYAVAVSPDGTKVYVTGKSRGAFATIAYNTSTGAAVWTRLYTASGPATAITVSPDGTKVFVTGDGAHPTPGSPYDYATVAYNAVTGALLWFSTFNGTANMNDYARAITVTPDSSRVIMTGYNQLIPGGSENEYVTIAYAATTGAQQWVSHFNPAPGANKASSVAMGPDGSFVAVTGEAGTIAYDTVTGAERWAVHDVRSWVGVAVAPDATKVYVTGGSFNGNNGDYATVAYAADTGTTLWVSTYDHIGLEFNGQCRCLEPVHEDDQPIGLAVSADGTKVVVTGQSPGGVYYLTDYATIAYNTTTGVQLWATRHNFKDFNSDDVPAAITIVPGDHTVIVTGGRNPAAASTNDFATAAIAL